MKQIPYKIIKHLGKLTAQNNGFTKELNPVSYTHLTLPTMAVV